MSGFRRVLGHAGWNLAGQVLPLVAALVALPWLAHRLGTERFGLLTLGWVLIGYFGLFDFGLGRAMTKLVAERAAAAERDGAARTELQALCVTGLVLTLIAGLAGSLLVAGASAFGGRWLADASPALRAEAEAGVWVVAVGIVPTVATAALRGVLEGLQRFKLLMLIRTPAGIASYVAPCLSVLWTPRLEWALASVVLTRWLLLAAHAYACRAQLPWRRDRFRPHWLGPMLRLGGWMTVSNVVGPVIVYVDRVVIGALVSPQALAHYAAPFEAVSRLLVFPVALSGALFPALAAAGAGPEGRTLRRRALGLTALCVLPLALLGGIYAGPLLTLWMGPDYAQAGTTVAQVLLVGFAFNALAQIPFAALHGRGCARQTACLHLIELPLYLALLTALVGSHGIVGAAWAWCLRGAFDALALQGLLIWMERRGLALTPTIDAASVLPHAPEPAPR